MITLKRAYDPVSRIDGTRFLVERLWPRGISKAIFILPHEKNDSEPIIIISHQAV